MSKIDEKAFMEAWEQVHDGSDDCCLKHRMQRFLEAYEAAKVLGDTSARKDEGQAGTSGATPASLVTKSPTTHQPSALDTAIAQTIQQEKDRVGMKPKTVAIFTLDGDAVISRNDQPDGNTACYACGCQCMSLEECHKQQKRNEEQPDELRQAALHDKLYAEGALAGWNAALSKEARHANFVQSMNLRWEKAREVLAALPMREPAQPDDCREVFEAWHLTEYGIKPDMTVPHTTIPAAIYTRWKAWNVAWHRSPKREADEVERLREALDRLATKSLALDDYIRKHQGILFDSEARERATMLVEYEAALSHAGVVASHKPDLTRSVSQAIEQEKSRRGTDAE